MNNLMKQVYPKIGISAFRLIVGAAIAIWFSIAGSGVLIAGMLSMDWLIDNVVQNPGFGTQFMPLAWFLWVLITGVGLIGIGGLISGNFMQCGKITLHRRANGKNTEISA